jgi:DNA-binding NarL/FixJ family response regulator
MNSYEGRGAVVVDRHPLWLQAVIPIVKEVGFVIVGQATSAEMGLELVRQHLPALLVTGITMDGAMDGIDLIRRSREVSPELKAVVLSIRAEPTHIDAALSGGAAAYVLKTAHPDDLRSAVRQAFNHSLYLPDLRPAPAAATADHFGAIPDLTQRELEILQLVAEGHSNSQLAKMLWVTEQTVKFHRSNIYRKLDVANRTEASRWAQVNGLLPAQSDRTTPAA